MKNSLICNIIKNKDIPYDITYIEGIIHMCKHIFSIYNLN